MCLHLSVRCGTVRHVLPIYNAQVLRKHYQKIYTWPRTDALIHIYLAINESPLFCYIGWKSILSEFSGSCSQHLIWEKSFTMFAGITYLHLLFLVLFSGLYYLSVKSSILIQQYCFRNQFRTVFQFITAHYIYFAMRDQPPNCI